MLNHVSHPDLPPSLPDLRQRGETEEGLISMTSCGLLEEAAAEAVAEAVELVASISLQ